jgi:hypothetical protein
MEKATYLGLKLKGIRKEKAATLGFPSLLRVVINATTLGKIS